MEKVTGIGGFFFRARDPQALNQWYAQHLGVNPPPSTYDEIPWKQESGVTVWSAFPEDSDFFGRMSQSWMINFRVTDLASMVAQLRSAGIEVEVDPQEYPNGWFAQLHDPEGNPIQLWQPKA